MGKIIDTTASGCIVILFQNDGEECREALAPGQFERARELLPDNLYNDVGLIWTPEVIEAWKARIESGINLIS